MVQDARLLTVFVCGICVTWVDGLCILFLLSLVHFFNLNWNWKILLWGKEFWVKRAVKKICLEGEYFIYRMLFSYRMEMLKSWCLYPILCILQRAGQPFMTTWCSWFSAYICTYMHMYMYIFHIHIFIYTHVHLDDMSIHIYDIYGMYMTAQSLRVVKCC